MPDTVTLDINGARVQVAAGVTVAAALDLRRGARAVVRYGHLLRVSRDHRRASARAQLPGTGARRNGGADHMSGPLKIVVVGAGPAGIAAAVRASGAGAAVTVIDDNPAPGGQIWRHGNRRHGGDAQRWFSKLRNSSATMLAGNRVIAPGSEPGRLLVEMPDGARELPFDRLILATGAREIFLPFPGWTLPGVTGAGGLQALVQGGLPIAGKRVVVAGSGPLLLAVAAFCRSRGAQVCLVAEQASTQALFAFALRLTRAPGNLLQALRLRAALAGVGYRTSSWVEAAEGDGRLESVRVRTSNTTVTLPCDYAAVAYGLFPNTELAALLGCQVTSEGVVTGALQETSRPSVYSSGECAGIGGVELSLVEGEIAGLAAAGDARRAQTLLRMRERARRFASHFRQTFALRPELMQLAAADTIFCRCEDVRFAGLADYTTFRAAKLHTRCGMGTCQGRVCGTAGQFLFGWTNDSVRPPVFPASVEALAAPDSLVKEVS